MIRSRPTAAWLRLAPRDIRIVEPHLPQGIGADGQRQPACCRRLPREGIRLPAARKRGHLGHRQAQDLPAEADLEVLAALKSTTRRAIAFAAAKLERCK